jgi:N-methylhydantoinase B/oxoprolinase/acetone carboxylase alpha subunit
VIAERRRRGPAGRAGGADSAPGPKTHKGREKTAKWSGQLAAGDVKGHQTPGGGGHRAPAGRRGPNPDGAG